MKNLLLRGVQRLGFFVLFLPLVTSCHNNDGNGGGGTEPTTKEVQGTLVVPQQQTAARQKIMRKVQSALAADPVCPNVPAGYEPLANIPVDFLDANDTAVHSTTTDDCGDFSATVPKSVVSLLAVSPGNKDLKTSILVFETSTAPNAPNTGVASTIPNAADYEISSIQVTDDNKLAFTVIDNVTNNAVIGIPASAFSVTVNSNPVAISDLQSAAQTADPASVTLVMDASGSMDATVRDANGDILRDANGNTFDRFRLSALAAHTYLDNVSIDETGFVIFDGAENFMDDSGIASVLSILDSNGDPASYTFSTNGYTTDPVQLRFLVDAYNPQSSLYSATAPDPKHTDTPDLTIRSHPWGGSTALYDAIDLALDKTAARSNNRKIVIAMSDGGDNRSSNTEQSVIASAVAKSIPVHTLAFGGADEQTMENIANGTNANFFLVEDANLATAFQTIQTGIIFQYLATLADATSPGDTIELTLDFNGTMISRSITRPGGTPNQPPVANDQSVNTTLDTSVNITLTGSDGDNDPLTYAVVNNPVNGSLSGTAPTLTYTPDTGFTGTDIFTFNVNDGKVNSSSATVTITVQNVVTNVAPVAQNDSATTTEGQGVTIDVLANDTDADGDSLTITDIASQAANGVASIVGDQIRYTPGTGFTGTDSFIYTISDGNGHSVDTTVSVTVVQARKSVTITCPDNFNSLVVRFCRDIDWGDGTPVDTNGVHGVSLFNEGETFGHTYVGAGTYTLRYNYVDNSLSPPTIVVNQQQIDVP